MIYDRDRLTKAEEKLFFDQWRHDGLLDNQDRSDYFLDAYKPQNRWSWLLSFILTMVAAGALFGVVMMFTGFDIPALPVALSALSAFWLIEKRIKSSDSFLSGEVSAAILIAGLAVISFIPSVVEKDPGNLYWGLSGSLCFIFLTRRYISSLSLVTAAIFVCYLLFTCIENYISAALVPFVFMIVSAVAFIYSEMIFHKADTLWKPKVLLGRQLSLMVLILSGNYYVVRVLSESLLGTYEEIQYSYFFYLYSTAFPVFICYYGLKRKLRPELVTGILGLVAGILGIRAYHSIMPLEYALLLSGLVMFVVGYLTVMALKRPAFGLSVHSSSSDGKLSKVNELILGFVVKSEQPSDPKLEGGGQFGGGGAGSKF